MWTIPETPLTVPFTHNTWLGGKKSYSEAVKWDYRRLKPLGRGIRRGDCVVFNFPHGDTVLSRVPAEDYYAHVRINGREYSQRGSILRILHGAVAYNVSPR